MTNKNLDNFLSKVFHSKINKIVFVSKWKTTPKPNYFVSSKLEWPVYFQAFISVDTAVFNMLK